MNMKIVANLPERGLARIEIRGQQIAEVQILGPIAPEKPFMSPGLVDVQINGFGGVDFSASELAPEQVTTILPSLWGAGVTTFCPTLITNSIEQLEKNFRILEAARHMDARFAQAVPCYHLEGPYLSPDGARGAHNPEFMKCPSWEDFCSLQEAANGNIGIVTIAPELAGAIDFIRRASTSGVIIAVGHTDALPEQVHDAANAGARLSTHLGNGCPTLIHRHQNPLWAQLADERLNVSLICDGFHLPPDFVRVVHRVKGVGRILLITDAVHVAGLSPGRYQLVGKEIELLPSGQVVTADRQSMAGSALTMNRAVAVFQQFTQTTLAEALQAASSNPAQLLARSGLTTEIKPGQPANLFTFHQQPNVLTVEATFSQGEQVYRTN